MAWSGIRRGIGRWAPKSTMLARDAVGEALALLPQGARIVDVGAGGRRITPSVVTVDGDARTNPDVVCDVHRVPLASSTFDGAFCTGTLEHVADPVRVGSELVRLLRTGGIAYIDVPFIQGFHADPHDYRRWTLPGLRSFCTDLGLEEVSSGVHLGPGSALSWIASEYLRAWLGAGVAGRIGVAAVRVVMRPVVWADKMLVRRSGAHRIASGVFFVGRKS